MYMPEGKEERQRYTRDMLSGDTREVADELQGNIAGFFKEKGVENLAGLSQSLKQGRLSPLDVAPVRKDIKLLQQILETGEIPEALFQKRRMKDAERIFGEDFLGPEAVEKTFGVELSPDEVPDIPFTKEEMERAKELDQMLILRTDKDPSGGDLTMYKMGKIFDEHGNGKLLFNTDWYNGEQFFNETAQTPSWALVSKDLIPNSTNKNYLQQTQVIADYIIKEVYRGQPLPAKYAVAIEEFDRLKDRINTLMGQNRFEEASQRLSELMLNQFTRRTAAVATYDLALRTQNNDERLLEGKYDWTMSRSSSGYLVSVGNFVSDGANVSRWDPGLVSSSLGVVLSRT
jgi:hypothetical protein